LHCIKTDALLPQPLYTLPTFIVHIFANNTVFTLPDFLFTYTTVILCI